MPRVPSSPALSKPSAVSAEDMNAFFLANFKGNRGNLPDITLVAAGHIIMNAKMGVADIRPPNFIKGPTQMKLADHCAYAVIFTRLGITPMAVTSNLNIDFLRPCIGERVNVEGKLIKLGRSLAIISVELKGAGSNKLASRATVTYALPQT